MQPHLPSLIDLPDPSAEAAVLERWGVARCDSVQMAALSTELTRLLTDEVTPPNEPEAVIAWIRDRHHAVQENRLEDAIAMATTAGRVHRRDDAWPHGLADQLIDMLDAIITHQQREEAVVFPVLLEGDADRAAEAIEDIVADHEALLGRWRRIAEMTGGFTAPAHACATWRLLYVLCGKLQVDLREQVELENRMLFAGRAA